MDEIKFYRVVCASGIPALDADLQRFSDMHIIGTCQLRSDIPILMEQKQPDILVISDNIQGEEEIIEMIIQEHRKFPKTRIVYLAGVLDPKDLARTDQLGALVINGIYDIVLGKITPNLIRDIIIYPKSEASVAYLKTHLLSKKAEIQNAVSGLEYEGFGEQIEAEKKNENIFLVWSPKPGSGKSFISANLAAGVAKYGVDHPKVALIDGDIQNLSIGNIMGLPEDKERNLKVAMQAISDILEGRCDNEERMRRAEKTVKNSFVRYKNLANLDILAGSSLTPQEIYDLSITGDHYKKLMEIIGDVYDYIIVDLNSSIFHPSTYTLMELCKETFCIINLDYNNILNSSRYKSSLEQFGVSDKIHYILNQDFDNDGSGRFGTDKEELNLTGDNVEEKIVHLDARIPNVEPSIFFNRQLDGKPIILYKKSYTEQTRLAFLKLAERICPIEQSAIEELSHGVAKKKGFGFYLFRKKKDRLDDELEKEEQLLAEEGVGLNGKKYDD